MVIDEVEMQVDDVYDPQLPLRHLQYFRLKAINEILFK